MDASQLQAIFPKTLELLYEDDFNHLQIQFHSSVKKDLTIISDKDKSRWFPVFLKLQGMKREILEVAEYEYLKHSVANNDLGVTRAEDGILQINITAQFVELYFDQPKLGKMSGLYCFYKCDGAFYEFQIGLHQALILDLLQQDRKYSIQQLIEMAQAHQIGLRRNHQEWKHIIDELINVGLLILTA